MKITVSKLSLYICTHDNKFSIFSQKHALLIAIIKQNDVKLFSWYSSLENTTKLQNISMQLDAITISIDTIDCSNAFKILVDM